MTTLSDIDQVLAMPPEKGGSPLRLWHKSERYVLPLIALAILVGSWQAIVDFRIVNPLFVAAPTSIAVEIIRLFGQSIFWVDMKVSGEELLLGLGISMVVASSGL